MPEFRVEVKGAEALERSFDKFDKDAEQELLNEFRTLVNIVAGRAKADAPKDTGAGAASIRTNTGLTKYGKPFGTVIAGGGDAYYMRMQEYGTSRIPAKRFLRGAIDAYKDSITNRIQAVMRRVKWQ